MTTHRSPRGRLIDFLEGDPDAIFYRGTEITSLGDAMADSATLLARIKDHASDQQGKAIEELRESIGDAGETLDKAAKLYSPVGPVLTDYSLELIDHKQAIDELVVQCRDLAESVPAVVPEDAGDDDPEAASAREAQDAWEEKAHLFDAAYDEWEDAFEKAVNGITDEMVDAIGDGFWRTFLDELGTLLGIAGLILAVLALVITGPVIFWVALGVGLAALLVTSAQYCYGDKDGMDVGLAVLAVIPFGKAGTGLAKGAGRFMKGGSNLSPGAAKFAPSLDDAPASNRLVDTMMRGLSGKSVGDFHAEVAVLAGSNRGADIAGGMVNAVGGFAEMGVKYYTGGITVSGLAS